MVQRSKGDSLSRFVGSDVSFAKAKAEIFSLLGKSEAQSIIDQVLKELACSDGKACSGKDGKRAKGKASQRKGYG